MVKLKKEILINKIIKNQDTILYVIIMLIILSSIGDLITTNLFLKNNLLEEGNSFVKWSFNKFGFGSLILIKLICIPLIFLVSRIGKIYGAIFALPSVFIDIFATIRNATLLKLYS